jgi:uncharacterized protein (DUF2235 family)
VTISADSKSPPKRRLIACCDGTWNIPDRHGHTTNVVRLVRSIRSCTPVGISQIVFYHPGVGTGNVLDKWIGGGTGIGLSENDRSAYAWFVDNYEDRDEIFLSGSHAALTYPGMRNSTRPRSVDAASRPTAGIASTGLTSS